MRRGHGAEVGVEVRVRGGCEQEGYSERQRNEGEKRLSEKEKLKECLLCWERCLELRARPPLEVKGLHCVWWVPLLQLICRGARGHITLGGTDERSQVGLGIFWASYRVKLPLMPWRFSQGGDFLLSNVSVYIYEQYMLECTKNRCWCAREVVCLCRSLIVFTSGIFCARHNCKQCVTCQYGKQ